MVPPLHQVYPTWRAKTLRGSRSGKAGRKGSSSTDLRSCRHEASDNGRGVQRKVRMSQCQNGMTKGKLARRRTCRKAGEAPLKSHNAACPQLSCLPQEHRYFRVVGCERARNRSERDLDVSDLSPSRTRSAIGLIAAPETVFDRAPQSRSQAFAVHAKVFGRSCCAALSAGILRCGCDGAAYCRGASVVKTMRIRCFGIPSQDYLLLPPRKSYPSEAVCGS